MGDEKDNGEIWQPFDSAKMRDLEFYVVEFADGSVGMDTWEVDAEGWQQIEPEADVRWVCLIPRRLP